MILKKRELINCVKYCLLGMGIGVVDLSQG